ncbi:MAG: acyl carrier protein [Pleurocapsa sp.]
MSNQTIIQNWLVTQLAEQLSLDASKIDVTEPLTRYGLDSIDAVTMVGDIEDILDEELPSTLFWDYPTVEKSAQFLAENYDVSAIASTIANPPPIEELEETVAAQAVPSGGKWGGLFGRK